MEAIPVSRLEQRHHVSPRSDKTQTVDLGGSDVYYTSISCIVYIRSWLSARSSVDTIEHVADKVSHLASPGCKI